MNKLIRGKSIFHRISLILCMTALLQGAIFFVFMRSSDTFNQISRDAKNVLAERVEFRANSLYNVLTDNINNRRIYNEVINAAVQMSETGNEEMSPTLFHGLLSVLNSTRSSGAFVILDADVMHTSYYPSLYLRDTEPASIALNNADILALYGSGSYVKQMAVPFDTLWRPHVSLDANEDTSAFYFKPLQAASAYPDLTMFDLGYWSQPFQLSENDVSIITYTLPLRNEAKEVIGVVGIEFNFDYLKSLLNYDELNKSLKSAYALGILNSDNSIQPLFISGPAYSDLADTLQLEDPMENTYSISNIAEASTLSYRTLNLYNANTPFSNEQWALMGIVHSGSLLTSVKELHMTLLLSFLISLVIALCASIMASYFFTSPVKQLAQRLKAINNHGDIHLPKVNIAEIDDLSQSIEKLSKDVSFASSRLSQILHVVNIPLGAIEYSNVRDYVYCTEMVAELLEFSPANAHKMDMRHDEFIKEIEQFREKIKLTYPHGSMHQDHSDIHTVQFKTTKGIVRWIRFHVIQHEEETLIVVNDVTDEIREKQKLEYERDYDPLTKLLNRNAFRKEVNNLLAINKDQPGAMIMWDLDNLKYINDTYGHDYGDKYIASAAHVFNQLSKQNAIVSRMAGDEFLAYIYKYNDQKEVKEIIRQVQQNLLDTMLKFSDNTTLPIRASAGISWYPDNGITFDELVRHADFAMYNAKNTIKGGVKEFSPQNYARDELLFSGKEELNMLIEENRVRFVYQPIVDATTGDIYGYEALMRPISDNIKSPLDLFRLAKAQSKLYQMEELTWMNILKEYCENIEHFGGRKIFLNSIPNAVLPEYDFIYLETNYGDYLKNIVVEIIESDDLDIECMKRKQEFCHKHNALIAIDDYGSGYNNEGMLLKINPHFIKIDMEIVQGVARDKDREQLVKNIVQFAHSKNSIVIAEGIENMPDLQICIKLGVDLVQGYYLGKPNSEIIEIKDEKKKLVRSLAQVYET